MHPHLRAEQSKRIDWVTMENNSHDSHFKGRRNLLAIIGAMVAAAFFGESAKGAQKPPAKKVVKKPVTKAPVKKSPPKPVAKSTPSAAPSPSASRAPTSAPTSSTSASPSPVSPSTTPSALQTPEDAREVIYEGKALKLKDFVVGSTLNAKYAIDRGFQQIIITRVNAFEINAFIPVCPHLGGDVSIDGNILYCSRHGAKFNRSSGTAISGPTSAPLQQQVIQVIDGVLYRIPSEND